MFFATFGTMASGKTRTLVETLEIEKSKGLRTCCLSPEMTRCRNNEDTVSNSSNISGFVTSRDGMKTETIFVDQDEDLAKMFRSLKKNAHSYPFQPIKIVDVIFVDEIQFFSTKQILQLKAISKEIKVCTYGLFYDCDRKEFTSSRLCLDSSDFNFELFAKCENCNGVSYQDCLVKAGNTIEKTEKPFIGINDRYLSLCLECVEKLKDSYFDYEVFRG